MKRSTAVLTGIALVAALGVMAPAISQVAGQTVMLSQVDPAVLATGWRATKIIGEDVFNDAGEEIGKLEDLIVSTKATAPYVVVSVGGFLGMGAHHVVVPVSVMEMVDKKLTLHGATKDSLKALPNFEFAS